MSEWISVEDRLPKKDGKYMVARWDCGKYSISVRKFREDVPCWYTGYCGHWERRTRGITHWCELPLPPLNNAETAKTVSNRDTPQNSLKGTDTPFWKNYF